MIKVTQSLFALLVFSFVIINTSCTSTSKQALLQASGCDTSTVTYSNTISTMMTNYCTNCHGGSSPSANISLEGYVNVKSYVNSGNFWGSMNHDNGYSPMPQGASKLDDCSLSKIKAWINAGALNN